MWVRHFWGPLQGAPSQFIDIQGFDLLTRGMSLRLRQPCLSVLCWVEKPGGPPAPNPCVHGCHGEQISPAALCHTHVGTFSLSSSLSFLSVTFYHAASPRGLPKRAFCPPTKPGVSWTSPYIYTVQRRAGSENPNASLPRTHGNRYISSLLWDLSECFVSKDMSGQVVNMRCRSPSPNNRQSYFNPQLEWRTDAPVKLHAKLDGVVCVISLCYFCTLTLVCLIKKIQQIKLTDMSKNQSTEINLIHSQKLHSS